MPRAIPPNEAYTDCPRADHFTVYMFTATRNPGVKIHANYNNHS